MWFYFQKVLIPHQREMAAAGDNPRGNLSDLYPRWLGARELLLRHRDPYSPEITREIQIGYYGRALTHANDPKDQQGFAYPAYVVLLLAPTVHMRFAAVQAGFLGLLATLTAASVLMWLRALNWRPSIATTAVLVVLTLGSYGAVQGIKLQQLSLLVSGLIAGCVALLSTGYLLLAGVLLALASIKPQLALPAACWLTWWAVSEWKSRQRFVWGFALTMSFLVGGAELLLPGWISRFRIALAAYRQYTGPSLLDILVTPPWSGVLAGLLLVFLAAVCWKWGRAPAQSEGFVLVLALVLTVTVVVVPMFAPYNQLLLLPGLLLALRRWKDLRSNWSRRFLSGIAIVTFGWPWLVSSGLMLASIIWRSTTLQRAWAIPLYTSPAMPLVVLALLLLLAPDIWRAGAASTRMGT